MERPNAFQWVHYAFGGRLPERYRDWVLHDTTSRTWVVRFVVRVLAETVPWLVAGFVLLELLTPLPAGLILGALAIALVTTLYFTITSADELTEARLVKHGFPAGTGKATRAARH
ncbi:hypothetical protein BLA60_32715 [Actinophytocola xinjiangensis]|uniref:DUF5313 domain-containing protein n=1 Tax=Actinophytocola xinjiangensis TaxID=485602 RepID=A0A7Z1AV87_9PSEU|nr:DUF5313 family protein [Actinophytocola xinjiangensis]OLF06108.1 hypothetical protein BLA60_32715 [Actinophytocola xinjiangensis]